MGAESQTCQAQTPSLLAVSRPKRPQHLCSESLKSPAAPRLSPLLPCLSPSTPLSAPLSRAPSASLCPSLSLSASPFFLLSRSPAGLSTPPSPRFSSSSSHLASARPWAFLPRRPCIRTYRRPCRAAGTTRSSPRPPLHPPSIRHHPLCAPSTPTSSMSQSTLTQTRTPSSSPHDAPPHVCPISGSIHTTYLRHQRTSHYDLRLLPLSSASLWNTFVSFLSVAVCAYNPHPVSKH